MSERKLILSMQITLDGYVAGPNDEADWLIISDDGWKDLIKTFIQQIPIYWEEKCTPVIPNTGNRYYITRIVIPIELKFAKLADKTQHIVFTKGDFKPDWKNTRVAHDLPAEVARLKKENGKNIIAWGGANFATNLIKLGLVDEYRFALNPTILAKGKSLFNNLEQRKKLILIDSKPLKSGLIILRYQPEATSQKREARAKSLESEIN